MIRRGRIEDRDALEALYDTCFPGEPQFRKWFFDRVWLPERTLIYEIGGRGILSNVMDLPIDVEVGGVVYPAHYIYAAGTALEARGQQLMSMLLKRAFLDGVVDGQAFSVLITQNDSLLNFYRPFGYTCVSELSAYRAEPRPAPDGYSLRRAHEGDMAQLSRLYRADVSGSLAVVRDGVYWRHMLELYGENFFVFERQGGILDAYAALDELDGQPFIKEAMGPRQHVLAEAICNHLGHALVYQSIAEPGRSKPNGCIKGLTPQAQDILSRLKAAPYVNLMYN